MKNPASGRTTSKKALVTGATGSLGKSIVKALAKSDTYNKIYACYLENTEMANQLSLIDNVTIIKTDLKELDLTKLPDDVDVLINNAGIAASKSLAGDVSEEEYNHLMTINSHSPLKLIQKYLPYMISKYWGRIINIGSIWSLRGSERNIAYTMSKHSLSGLTKTVAIEYIEYGITCNEICPGPMESDMVDKIFDERAKSTGRPASELKEEFVNTLRSRRMATTDEVASAVRFLASYEASGINGVSLPVDLGFIS